MWIINLGIIDRMGHFKHFQIGLTRNRKDVFRFTMLSFMNQALVIPEPGSTGMRE